MQANARLHRQGQEGRVVAHRLCVEGGRDMDVLKALAAKAGAQDWLMESLRARIERHRADAGLRGRVEVAPAAAALAWL